MITYPIDMPDVGGPINITYTNQSAVAKQQNPFTYQTKVYVWDGQQRTISVDLGVMSLAKAKAWQAFFYALNGIEGTFLWNDWIGRAARGSNGPGTVGSPKVNGAGQVGKVINMKSFPTSKTGLLLAGDWISINNRLYTILEDCNSDGSGNTSVSVWPYLTGTLADNTQVFVGSNSQGAFRLTAWTPWTWDINFMMSGVTFTAEEAF